MGFAALHPRERLRQLSWVPLVLVACVGAIVGLVTWLMEYASYDTYASILVVVGLVAISIPMLRRAAANERDPRITRLLWIAFCAKLLAALPRYVVAFGLYDGRADAASYDAIGAELARQFRSGDFTIDIGREVQGTGFIQILTGAVYTVTGATNLGGFVVFSWFGFWGLYCMYRAFALACPDGDHRRYALLVLLLPSLLFWPSSIGKEAWMTLGLGLMALGSARLLTGSRGGWTLLVAGGVATAVTRPHITAIFTVAVVLAYLVRRQPSGRSILAPIGKIIGVLTLGALAALSVGQLQSYLGVDAFDRESVQLVLEEVTRQTGQGGSVVVDSRGSVSSPADVPYGLITVAIRPFPWEANNSQSLISSGEGVLLLILFIAGWRRLLGAIGSVVRTPYIVLCLSYVVLFTYGFSSFSNFGILARQRVQVLPFLLVLLCIPPLQGRLRDAPRALLLDDPTAVRSSPGFRASSPAGRPSQGGSVRRLAHETD